MGTVSLDLRRAALEAYRSGLTKTYDATAEMFGIGRASFNRWLRRHRDTGDVKPLPRGGNNPIVVDAHWLRAHAAANPDERLVDRIAAWAEHSGRTVSMGAMWNAMKRIGWTHKKRRSSRANGTTPRSKRAAKASSLPSRRSKRDG